MRRGAEVQSRSAERSVEAQSPKAAEPQRRGGRHSECCGSASVALLFVGVVSRFPLLPGMRGAVARFRAVARASLILSMLSVRLHAGRFLVGARNGISSWWRPFLHIGKELVVVVDLPLPTLSCQ